MRRVRSTLAGQAFLLQLVVLSLVIGGLAVLAVFDARRSSDATIEQRVTDVAVSVAAAPSTRAAVAAPDPTALLQPVTEEIRRRTGMDFIVVMAPDRTRYTHTDPARIGLPFSGTIDRALAGETFTETYTGTLGPSIRAVTPVRDGDRVVALVSAGVTRDRIADQVARRVPTILAVAAAGLLVAAAGSLLLARRLRRQTLGLAPDELRVMYEHHDAVLHSIHEGLVVFGPGQRAEVVNDEARRLLDLPDGVVRRADLPPSLRALGTGVVRDETHVTADRVLLVNQDVVTSQGRPLGTVLTLRDHTELRGVLGELASVRGFAESLRAQAHEAANRLHTVVTMVELGRHREAVEFATAELELSQALIDRLTGALGDPALVALLLGKVDQAAERGVELTVAEDTALDSLAPLTPGEAVTLLGNLIDNAIDAAADSADAWVEVSLRRDEPGAQLHVRVGDSGPGLSAEDFARAAERGYTTKDDHHGLGLALVHRLVTRHGGTITAERSPESTVTVRIPYGGPS
ncbi:sensor histidine kinase [Nocardia farcinica]|uniref:sensor histidine kinase n=1 Tax=Nocardia farcinica TaxID=37329 RepID=UPI000A3BCEC7|nr:ATP-binding protein [Nocardia farcinica]MBA4854942.1 GHKL domain-containing protein [Nocardia farcinica]MBC9814895.1 GHKL domain-containing protein [Nocardia farcinica]MBF6070490.1 GHKL domain-containing protein [Nocardia farcinica]MBF6269937.1 GHKL domain-containing protein [Nocardia farcinica]MBF6374665.1 GHKL domain-containing protein [Nocardia farcinica]